MSLRIGFDMDGVLANFSSAFYAIETHLFGPGTARRVERPEEEEEDPGAESGDRTRDSLASAAESRRRRDEVWRLIKSTPDFWTLLKPTDPRAVARIRDQALKHRWEVFFITQRPATAGDTVQRQTQRWLIAQGFDMPSVLVIGGSRGAAAGALRLDYHVDDSAQNCLDVMADAHARPILIVPADDDVTAKKARGLGIGVANTISQCLDVLDQASAVRQQPAVLQKLATLVGWNHRTAR
jgi:hypothetical protein